MRLKFQQENITKYTRLHKNKTSYEIKARRFLETINGKDSGFNSINGTFFLKGLIEIIHQENGYKRNFL